jgi:hypothetical protein
MAAASRPRALALLLLLLAGDPRSCPLRIHARYAVLQWHPHSHARRAPRVTGPFDGSGVRACVRHGEHCPDVAPRGAFARFLRGKFSRRTHAYARS